MGVLTNQQLQNTRHGIWRFFVRAILDGGVVNVMPGQGLPQKSPIQAMYCR